MDGCDDAEVLSPECQAELAKWRLVATHGGGNLVRVLDAEHRRPQVVVTETIAPVDLNALLQYGQAMFEAGRLDADAAAACALQKLLASQRAA